MDGEGFVLPEKLRILVTDEVSCGTLTVLRNTFSLPEMLWKRYVFRYCDKASKMTSLRLSHEKKKILKVELLCEY